jgi:hypothetical protein
MGEIKKIDSARAPVSHPFASRPETLAGAIARTNSGGDFSFALSEFLDTFYGHVRRGEVALAQGAIDDEPAPMLDICLHAYVGGVGEHLARRWSLPRIPAWTNHPSRFLQEPLFGQTYPGTKYIYLEESPLAFRRRLIFTEAVPLRRARMPQ